MSFLYKSNSIFSSVLLTSKRRNLLSFRKSLGVYNYKIKGKSYFKNPHSVERETYNELKSANNEMSKRKLAFIKRNSNTPYGRLTNKGNFRIDYSRVPLYDLKNILRFHLRPFISKRCCRIYNKEPEDYTNGLINKEILEKIRIQMLFSTDVEVRKLGYQLFETQYGKEICKDFVDSQWNGKFFDFKNMNFYQNRKNLKDKMRLSSEELVENENDKNKIDEGKVKQIENEEKV